MKINYLFIVTFILKCYNIIVTIFIVTFLITYGNIYKVIFRINVTEKCY